MVRAALNTLIRRAGAAALGEASAQEGVELVQRKGLFKDTDILAGGRTQRAQRGMAGREGDREAVIDLAISRATSAPSMPGII